MTILIMNLFKDKLTICAQSIATVDFSYFLPRPPQADAAKTELRQQSQAFTLD